MRVAPNFYDSIIFSHLPRKVYRRIQDTEGIARKARERVLPEKLDTHLLQLLQEYVARSTAMDLRILQSPIRSLYLRRVSSIQVTER